MTERPAQLNDLLQAITEGLTNEDPLPPHKSAALDALTDALQDDEIPSPASAFVAAQYVLAQHARELAELLVARRLPDGFDGKHWAAAQLREYATSLDGQTPAA